jgi:hypothetical protein
MTTKQQERDTLAQIQKIIADLGSSSYVGTALNGVLHYAEENIEYDAAFTAPASLMHPARHIGYATNMKTADYLELEKSGDEMTEERAKIIINDECAFEVSHIKILQEAEIDTTEPGAGAVTYKKVPRKPLYCSTDWNYVRFNVRVCCGEHYYEFINGQLHEVYL